MAEGVRESSEGPIRTLISSRGLHHHDPITSQSFCPPNTITLGLLGLNIWILGRNKYSVYSTRKTVRLLRSYRTTSESSSTANKQYSSKQRKRSQKQLSGLSPEFLRIETSPQFQHMKGQSPWSCGGWASWSSVGLTPRWQNPGGMTPIKQRHRGRTAPPQLPKAEH